jgi:hypothetical protein
MSRSLSENTCFFAPYKHGVLWRLGYPFIPAVDDIPRGSRTEDRRVGLALTRSK